MKTMIKSIVAALAVIVGLNAWAGFAKLNVECVPSNVGTASGGTGGKANTKSSYNVTLTAKAEATAYDYKFAYWSTTQDKSGWKSDEASYSAEYATDASYAATQTYKLYAIFEATTPTPTGSLDGVAAIGGTLNGTTVTASSSQLVYEDGAWYAGLTFTWAHSKTDGTLGGWQDVQYTAPEKAKITVAGTDYTGTQAVAGAETANGDLSGTTANDTFYPDSFAQTGKKSYTYLNTLTWRVKITPEVLKEAANAQQSAATFTATVGGLVWGNEDQGSKDGVAYTTYTISVPLDENTKLVDDKGNQHYPTPHVHVWAQNDPVGGKVTWTCQTTDPACSFDEPFVTFDAANKVYDGETVAFKTTKSEGFDALLPSVTIGEVKYFKADGETEIAAPKYTGSYVAKVVVGEKPIKVDFSITKPTSGYTDGWEVNCDVDTVRYDTWDEAIAAAADGDTVIYYREKNRDFETHEYSVGDKNITIDFGGAVLKYTTGMKDMTLKNTGSATVTFQNVTIQQPKYGFAYQIVAEGNIAFGTGVKTTNKADSSDRYLTITSTSGTLEVKDGLYQNGFATDGGTVVLKGGKFWSHDKPADSLLAENYVVRMIEGDYIYEVFGHTHDLYYEAIGNIITLKCKGDNVEDCPYTITPQKLVLTAGDAKYTGLAYAGASYVVSNDFVVSGAELGDIEFYQGETKLDEAPTAMGGYTAKITVTFDSETFTAVKAFAIGHDHLWEYSAEDDTLTATCTNTCPNAPNVKTLILKVEDKTFGGTAVVATLENGEAFTEATKATVGPVTYLDKDGAKIDAPKNAGKYKAQVVVTPGDVDGIVLEKAFEIKAKEVSNVTVTLDKVSALETGSEITAKIVSVSDGTTTYTTADYDVDVENTELTGKDRREYNVKLIFKGNYSGTAYGSWEIVEPTGSSTELGVGIKAGDENYGEVEDQTLTINDTTKLFYDKENEKWFASLTIIWPRTVKTFLDNKLGWIPVGVQHTDVDHLWVKIGGTKYTGKQIADGEVEGLSLATANGHYYKNLAKNTYTFVTSVTWTVEISTNELEKALEKINSPKMAMLGAANATATPTLDKNGFLNYKATFGAYAWGDETEGDVDGLEDTKLTIRLKPEETTLFDENQIQVWPHHDHDWEYVIADGKCTATCSADGCPIKTIAVELQGERTKAFDGQPLKLTVSNAVDFALHTGCEVSGVQYYKGTQELGEEPQVVGVYYAVFLVNGQEIKVEIEVTTETIAKAIATLKETFDFDFNEKVNELGTIKVGDLTLVEGDDYEIAETSELKGTGSAREDTTYTVTLTGKGNYAGTTNITWTVKAPSGAFDKIAKAENVGGTLDGSTLTMASGDNYGWKYYTAENAPDKSGVAGFYAGITATYSVSLTLADGIQFTDLAHAFFTVGGQRYMGNETIPGVSCETVKKSFSDLFSSLSLAKSASEDTSYMKTFTWWQRLDLADLRAAQKAEAAYVTNGISAGALVWKAKFAATEYGDKDGIRETDFTILTKMDDLYLYDNDQNLVWPEHDHQWTWTVAGNVLTAACDVAGCQYAKNPQVLTIASEVAEKYCDTKPVTATLTGAEAFAEATEATVGAIEYWQGETKLAGAPAEPGDYAATCTVVSKDLAATNTIAAAFSILTGQAIWNGVHVADAAEYLEKKTQDSMEIFVGKDFTASKTFVVPASWKAETLTEVDMTIKQFIAAVKAGKFGDLYTWDDVLDLIAGRVTAEELFKRLQDTYTEYTLLDCGAKTFDLNGFTVTAAAGVPFLRNEGMLTLLGEGTMTTNGFETLLVNVGTLSIEGGKYVGNIENTGALVVSGGYFTGTISNAGEGTVVLTGGAYEIKPNKDFIPAGYDLVKRDGIYYVEKHEHKYTFLPLGKCLMSCTCWNWFVDDPDQIIQFSNCGAHKLGVFIGTRDNLTGILPKKEFATTTKPVEAEIVGYNYSALLKIGVLKNIKELVAIAEEAIEADENWDDMTALQQIETMLSVVTSIKDLDLDVSDLVWNQAKIEEETGLKFGEIKYYDDKTDEELAGAPSEAGKYRASVVITTPKGNDVTRSWKYSIGIDYKTDLEEWAEETKEKIEDGWKNFKEKIQSAFNRQPTEEETVQYFAEVEQSNDEYLQTSSSTYDENDQKIINAYNKLVEDVKNAHLKAKLWAQNAADEIKDLYEKHEETYLEDVKAAIVNAWDDKNYFEEFFDNLDADVRAWFEERKQNHKPVDEAIIKAHDDMVKELKIVHSSMVKWINETFGNLEEEVEEEAAPAPLLTMAAAPMAAAIEEEELTGWEKFKQEVKEKLGRLPTQEEIEQFFDAEGKRHAQFLEKLQAKGVTFGDELKAAHDKMVETIKSKNATLVLWVENAAEEIKDLYEKHEDTYFDEAADAIEDVWYDFCAKIGAPTYDDAEDFFEGIGQNLKLWFEERKQNHEPVDEAIIKAHDDMVEELKIVHSSMVAWLKGRFEQVSDSELKALPEEESEEAPALLTLSVADESKAYDGASVKFELKGKAYFERISGCTVEGPYFRPIKPTGPVTDIAPTAPGHYEVFYWIFKDGKKIEFLVKHVFYIEKLLADNVVVYFDNGTNFVYNAEEQGPKIWGVFCGLDELVEDADYEVTGTRSATEVGDYAFTVKGRGPYKMYEETFNWSIVAPTRTFEEGAFQIRAELEYNPCTKTWDTIATLDWPYDLRQIFRVPRYYTVDYAAAETTANYVDPTVEPVLREFYRIKTGQMEEYVKADVWTLPFTPEQLTEAAKAGYTAVTNTLTAYAIGSASEPAGMAKTNFEYVVNLEGLKLYDDKGRQCYPIHKHDWKVENLEDGTLVANCNCKSCPVGHVEIAMDAESKDWDGRPVWAEVVDEDDQFAIHTYAKIGDVVHTNEAGEPLRCWPTEPGVYRVYAPVCIEGNRYKVWKTYEIRALDISDAKVFTCPDKTEFIYSGFAYEMNVNAVVAGCRLLDEGVDYTVGGTLAATDVGDYQIVIEGTGHYTGTCTVDWSIVEPTREFAEEAFDQLTFEVPGPYGRAPYGEIDGKVLTITASTNLWYDVTTSNWYAGVTVDWPYELGQICHAPQFTVPEKAYVEVAAPTYTNVYTALDITMGEATNENLVADIGEFYRLRYLTWQKFVKRIGWDIEITLDDIVAARERGETSITYAITVGSPANREDPDGLAKTTYQIVLPLEGLVLEDDQTNRYHVAAFDANGGTFADGQKTNAIVVVEGQPFGELPANPTYDAHVFTKWTDVDGLDITAETVFTATNADTIVAQWTPGYLNTYDSNGGTFEGGITQKQYIVCVGSQDFCNISWIGATREGYTLTGWFDAPEGGEQVYTDKGYWFAGKYWQNGEWQHPGAITVYAQWKNDGYTVTYNGNGSKLVGGSDIAKYTVKIGQSDFCNISWIGADIPDMVLTGWFDALEGGEKVYDYYGMSVNGTYWQDASWQYPGDLTVYAQWMPGYWINFDCMGYGTNCKYPAQIGTGNYSDVSWIAISREGYELEGWYTKPIGGEKIYDGSGIAVDSSCWEGRIWKQAAPVTVYPHWRRPGGYMISFDFNGAEGVATHGVMVGIGDFADVSWIAAEREGHTFVGWFNAPEGGEKVYDAVGKWVAGTYWESGVWQYEGDLTVYAHWQAVPAPKLLLKTSVSAKPKTLAFADGVYSGVTVDGGVFTILLEDGADGVFDAYLYVDGETYDAEATAAGEVLTIETESDIYVMTKVADVWTLARQ